MGVNASRQGVKKPIEEEIQSMGIYLKPHLIKGTESGSNEDKSLALDCGLHIYLFSTDSSRAVSFLCTSKQSERIV